MNVPQRKPDGVYASITVPYGAGLPFCNRMVPWKLTQPVVGSRGPGVAVDVGVNVGKGVLVGVGEYIQVAVEVRVGVGVRVGQEVFVAV
jgi:hypothetical protein